MQLFANNAYGSLASGISDADTSLVLATGQGARFPNPTNGDHFLITLLAIDGGGAESAWEIVRVTVRSTDTLTVVRAQEGTTAQAWNAGTRVELRVTKGTLEALQPDATPTNGDLISPISSDWAYDHAAATATHGVSGALVGTTDQQTLTNKTISADSNTLSGIAASSFVLSNASGDIDGSAAQKAIPSGAVVGTTDTQTLTNKTLTNPVINGFTGDTSVINIGSGQVYKDTSGNVGIGTSSPFAKLAIEQPGGSVLNFRYNVHNGIAGFYIGGTSGSPFIGYNLVHSSGNVFNYGRTGEMWALGDPAGGGGFGISIASGTASNSAGLENGSTSKLKITSSGDVYITTLAGAAGAVYADANGKLNLTSSDARLKENIAPLTACLSKTLALNPVSFQWRDQASMGAKTNIGFIAQDMEAVVPEVVGHTVEGMKTLDYAKLVALLTGAIQEQQALIEQLNLRIAALEGA